jgi:diguanylate cyclase (GGDEF)-like protein
LNSTDPLADNLARIAAAWKNSPVVLFRQDISLRYVWIFNPFDGFSEEDILGKTDAELFPSGDGRLLAETKRQVMEERASRRLILRHPRLDSNFFYQWVIDPLLDEADTLQGVVGLVVPLSEGREDEERARLLASLSRSFAESGNDYEAVLETVARLVARAAGQGCTIRLVDETGGRLVVAAFAHINPAVEARYAEALRTGPKERSHLPADLLRDVPLHTNLVDRPDLLTRLPEETRRWAGESPARALLLVPLQTPRGLVGALSIWRASPVDPLLQEDLTFWQDVADRAALAIENARLYEDEVQRNRQLNALNDATAALLSTLDLEELLGRILDSVQTAIPAAERGVLYLVAPSTGRLEVRATSGFNDPRIRRTGLLRNNQSRRAMRERRPLLIADTAEAGAQGEDAEMESFRSAIFAPLLLGDEVLGTLSLSASRPKAFQQADLQLLVSFAATTTAALHNAMLHAELQKIAVTDPLTGLLNRRGMLEQGRLEVERSQRTGKPLSAVMIDIDHFKEVNDRYGHSTGDLVLCSLADRCRSLIRTVDIIGRYGGEEFAILLPETDMFQAAAIAERLRIAVESEPFFTEEGPVSITVSLGVSRAARVGADLQALIDQADMALYQAKQGGRNRVEIG